MTKIFLDTEFTGLHQGTSLVSMGLVAESGEEWYAELTDYHQGQMSELLENPETRQFFLDLKSKLWLTEGKYFDKTERGVYLLGNKQEVKQSCADWLQQFGDVEIWADVLAYDWVLFCQLFEGAFMIPRNIFYAPFDFATLLRVKHKIQPKGKYGGDLDRYAYAGADKIWQHNALMDARVEKICFQKIVGDE